MCVAMLPNVSQLAIAGIVLRIVLLLNFIPLWKWAFLTIPMFRLSSSLYCGSASLIFFPLNAFILRSKHDLKTKATYCCAA